MSKLRERVAIGALGLASVIGMNGCVGPDGSPDMIGTSILARLAGDLENADATRDAAYINSGKSDPYAGLTRDELIAIAKVKGNKEFDQRKDYPEYMREECVNSYIDGFLEKRGFDYIEN